MPGTIKLLILEDDPMDAELLQQLLKRSGLKFEAVVADDEEAFHAALERNGYHAVLADNALPQYSSLEALKLIKSTNPDVAFILVTGTVSEEFAVNIIKEGADDYILKTNLTRLPAAINNAIEKKRIRREAGQEREFSGSVVNSLPGVFYLYDEQGNFIRWNRNLETASGYTEEEVKQMRPEDFFDVHHRESVRSWIKKVFANGYAETEAPIKTRSGRRVPYFLTGTTIIYGKHTCLLGIGLDISSSKAAEKELKQLNDQLRMLSRHLHTVREDEQRRIAREIHDELGQQLTGLIMDVASLKKGILLKKDPASVQERLTEMETLLANMVGSVRRISTELHPSVLDDLGLAAALEWQSKQFASRFNIRVDYSAGEEVQTKVFNLMVSTGLFRMFQESMNNVAKHAEATVVQVKLESQNDILTLSITDNGKGFDPTRKGAEKTLGLLGMRERVYMIGGTLNIRTEPGKGTTVTITVPLGGGDAGEQVIY